ncbi:MAG: hypothetical protein EGQ86_03135, partial [Alistipes sp.]
FEAAGGELTDSQVSQIETAASQWIADAIKAELETAGSSINKWLGDELAVYMDQMTLGDNLLGRFPRRRSHRLWRNWTRRPVR